MKKYIYIILGIAIVVIAGLLIFVFRKNDEKITQNADFKYMGVYRDELPFDEYYIFTNYEEYKETFNSDKITEADFKNHNYVLVQIIYDECSELNITPTDYKIDGDTIDIMVKYEAQCGLCAPEYMYYLLEVDKTVTKVVLNINYKVVNDPDCPSNISYKPIIYLYPEEEIIVNVKLGYPNLLTTTYPKYNNGWDVVAKPNGELVDKTGRTFYGLYWEGKNYINSEFTDGFVVAKENLTEFLEEKLSILGLTEREADEFIIYWLPILEKNEYNLIRFESMDIINREMPLSINPTPDTVIRVLMEYKGIDNVIDIPEQKLVTPVRKGFTVVEWGGSLIK